VKIHLLKSKDKMFQILDQRNFDLRKPATGRVFKKGDLLVFMHEAGMGLPDYLADAAPEEQKKILLYSGARLKIAEEVSHFNPYILPRAKDIPANGLDIYELSGPSGGIMQYDEGGYAVQGIWPGFYALIASGSQSFVVVIGGKNRKKGHMLKLVESHPQLELVDKLLKRPELQPQDSEESLDYNAGLENIRRALLAQQEIYSGLEEKSIFCEIIRNHNFPIHEVYPGGCEKTGLDIIKYAPCTERNLVSLLGAASA